MSVDDVEDIPYLVNVVSCERIGTSRGYIIAKAIYSFWKTSSKNFSGNKMK